MVNVYVQIVGILATCVTTVVTALYGFKAILQKVDEKLTAKVDAVVYSARVSALHDANNATNIQLAKAETKIEYLEDKVHRLEAELHRD